MYVTLLQEYSENNYEQILQGSETIFEQINQSIHIIQQLELETTALDLCIDYFKLAFSMLISEFKQYMMEHYRSCLRPLNGKDRQSSSPYLLGYMLLSVNILEQVLRSFPYIHIMDMHPVDLSLDHCSMLAVW